MQRAFAAAGAACVLALAAVPAQAQLTIFGDEEARKAIIDLRGRVTQADARIAAQAEEIQQLRKSVLDLNSSLDQLRAELARSRGAQEQYTQLARELAELQRQQRDLLATVDERMRRVEPLKVTADGREFMADPQEKRQYEEAVARLRNADFDGASQALNAFLRRYPASGYADSANFWLGNALYGRREYRDAIAAFRQVAKTADHPRTPESLLAIANCQVEMKEVKAARATLTDLIKTYPDAEAAKAAKERLAALR